MAGQVAGMTRGLNGRDLRSLVERTFMQAIERALETDGDAAPDHVILSREDLLGQLPTPQPKP